MRIQVIDGTEIHSDNHIRIGTRIHGSGTVTRTWNYPFGDPNEYGEPRKEMCAGCEDDFYNGHNPYGVKECWAFKTAVVCNKVGYSSIHVPNGPDTKMVRTLTCWHAVSK